MSPTPAPIVGQRAIYRPYANWEHDGPRRYPERPATVTAVRSDGTVDLTVDGYQTHERVWWGEPSEEVLTANAPYCLPAEV